MFLRSVTPSPNDIRALPMAQLADFAGVASAQVMGAHPNATVQL
jgi:hypothetical protein